MKKKKLSEQERVIMLINKFLSDYYAKRDKMNKIVKIDSQKSKPIKQTEGVIKRISRGLKIMYQKICNSDYVKNIQEEQKTADPNEFMPVGLSSREESQPDTFSTDFSN